MSETVRYTGKLERVSKKGETVETTAKRICKELKINKSSYNDTWLEQLQDTDEYFIKENTIYKINATEHDDSDDVFDMDESLNYSLKFYNGGCSLLEALETAWDWKNKRKK